MILLEWIEKRLAKSFIKEFNPREFEQKYPLIMLRIRDIPYSLSLILHDASLIAAGFFIAGIDFNQSLSSQEYFYLLFLSMAFVFITRYFNQFLPSAFNLSYELAVRKYIPKQKRKIHRIHRLFK